MSTSQEAMARIEPDPVVEDPGAIVEKTYPIEGTFTGVPDGQSTDGFTKYAIERFQGRDAGRDPSVVYTYEPRQVPKPSVDGWIISPRTAAAVTLAVQAAFNVSPNVPSALDDVAEIAVGITDDTHDTIADWKDPPAKTHTVKQTVVIPDQQHQIEKTFQLRSGAISPDAADISSFINQVQTELGQGNKLQNVYYEASASDEYGGKKSLARNDAGNDELALDRFDELVDAVDPVLMPARSGKGGASASEHRLTAQENASLQDTVARNGLSYEQAQAVYDSKPESLPPDVRKGFDQLIGSARYAKATAVLQGPDRQIEVEGKITTTRGNQEPENENNDYDLSLVPFGVPPVPRLSWKDRLTWWRRRQHTDPGRLPDNTFVKLYPEALQENGELIKDAWAYSRKYQLLLREDRIKGVLRFDYKDASGNDQSLRALFIDHEPTEATQEAFEQIGKAMAASQDGTMGEKLGAIAVFPEENAGTRHRDPKRIAVGVDEQYSAGVLGVAIPALGLVEMHMPTDPSREDLDKYLGIRWTLAHETTGHFTDTKNEPTRLRRVGNAARQQFVASDPWVGAGAADFRRLRPLEQSDMYSGPRMFEATYQVLDNNGVAHDRVKIVSEHDPILEDAQSTRIMGRIATNYGSTNMFESHAEHTAGMVTEIPIPYSEPGVTASPEPGFAQGYRIDRSAQQNTARYLGADPATDTLSWPTRLRNWESTYTNVEDDPFMHQLTSEARRTPLKSQLITILTKATGAVRK